MTAGPLIAFGLVFASVSLSLSLALNTLLVLAKPRLRGLGAWVERRAATAALLLPPLLALAVVTALAMESMLALAAGTDHCPGHDHHLHLCVRHGAAWLTQPWAVSSVAAASTFVAVRFGLAGWAHLMAQLAVNRLRSLGTTLGHPRSYLVPSGERFAFTAGLASPAAIISQGAWNALNPGERDAIVTHELAHLAHRDLWWRAVLGFAASLGAPVLSSRTLRFWELAAERLCDHEAILKVDRPSTVASAMLALARSAPLPLAPSGAVFAAANDVPARIESVLREDPSGRPASRRLALLLTFVALSLVVACAVFAAPLHHAFETLLG